MCGIMGPNFLKQNGTSPSKKGFFIGILVLFVFVTFFFCMAISLLYIPMFSFFFSLKFSSFLKAFRLLQLKHLLVNLKLSVLRIALVFDIYYSVGLNFLAVR